MWRSPSKTHICSNEAQLQDLDARARSADSLEKSAAPAAICPIYLAKLELINSAGGVFLGDVTGLPFQQMLDRRSHGSQSTGGLEAVTTSVRSLEYWQKPDVKAEFQPATKSPSSGFRHPLPRAIRLRHRPRHGGSDHARRHPGEQPGVFRGDPSRPGARSGGCAAEPAIPR